MDVLSYVADNGDYDITIQTEDISYAWQNFKGRINYRNRTSAVKSDPMRYCKYTSNDNCSIRLYNLGDGDDERVTIDSNQEYWPVVFETNNYHICIKFHGVDTGRNPKIVHVKKEIESLFYLDREKDSSEARLTGTIDFLNEPGLFILNFEYVKNGIKKSAHITFDVVSPKLDTKHDYKRILDDVNQEFDDLVFNYLSTTFQQLGKGNIKSLEIWMQKFHQVVNDYLKNVDRIIKNPHSKVHTYTHYAKADRIKRWSPAMEEEFEEKRRADRLDEHYFAYNQYETTVNSLENRFVKHTLKHIGGKLHEVFDKLLKNPNKDVSQNYINEWKAYQAKIEKYQKHPFFKSVGRFDGLKQESLVLQSRMGYQQIYKDWLKLKKGIDFYNGTTNIGTLQIWEIYELWCFMKVKNMVRELMGFDPKKKNSEYGDLISEPNGDLINYSKDKKADYRVVFKFPNPNEVPLPEGYRYKDYLLKHQGETVSLHYQHTFNRKQEDDFNIQTVTTEQRPDIVLNIKKSDDFVLTYLYDAKYRVWNDKTLDKDFEDLDIKEQEDIIVEDSIVIEEGQKKNGADYPPSDAINQMHRYRDAIYYSLDNNKRPDSKEIIGGYILFPGRGDDKKIKERYFYKSIKTVNIGAFPLLPIEGEKDEKGRDIEGPQLWEHLEDILLKKETAMTHIEDSVPQRGLMYVESSPKTTAKDGVIVIPMYGFVANIKNSSNGKYAIPMYLSDCSLNVMQEYRNTGYVIFFNPNDTSDKHMFSVGEDMLVLKNEDANNHGYFVDADENQGVVRYVCVKFNVDEEMDCSSYDIDLLDIDNSEKHYPHYTTLNELAFVDRY